MNDRPTRLPLSATMRRRALFATGGLVVGVLAVLMARGADLSQWLFAALPQRWPLATFAITPAGFALSALVTLTIARGAGGSGIPQVIVARTLDKPEQRSRLVSARIAIAKAILLFLGLASGASTGREGPTVQVGAAIMFTMGKLEPHRQPGLLLAGASAGIAAAFNAPIAGIIFGIEEMSRSFEQRSSVLVLVTVIIAGLTAQSLVGDYTYFGIMQTAVKPGWLWLAVPLSTVAGGMLGGLFCRLVVTAVDILPMSFATSLRRHPVAFAAACGCAVALCGYFSGGTTFGTGYIEAQHALNGDAVPVAFGPIKFLATLFSSLSGIPGGLFSPSLAIGAGVGVDLAAAFPEVPVQIFAILCMVSYLAGVVQAPLTSAVIVSEMTADHGQFLPIMLCALGASHISRLFSKEGVYQMLAARMVATAGDRPPAS